MYKVKTTPERKVGKNLDETVMQYIVRRIHIARIAETYHQHLLGIDECKVPFGLNPFLPDSPLSVLSRFPMSITFFKIERMSASFAH